MDAGLRTGLCSIKTPSRDRAANAALIQRSLVAAYGCCGQDVGKGWAPDQRVVGGLFSALFVRRDLLDQVNDAAPQLGVADPHECLGQRQAV
jgi:hypothetical protein